MKTVQNKTYFTGLAGAVLAATLFCLPSVTPAHAEESSAGSSVALPVDAQLVSFLKQAFTLLDHGRGAYDGHRARALADINRTLACYNDHYNNTVPRGLGHTSLTKQAIGQAKSLLEQALARAPKDSEPQKLIEQAIKQTDQCLAFHGAN
jgi:hypothetical protein